MYSVVAVGAGFVIFSVLFSLLGSLLGAVIATIPAGLMAGYLSGKLAGSREVLHAGVAAGLVGAALLAAPQLPFTLTLRVIVTVLAVGTLTAGAWVREQARLAGVDDLPKERNDA